MYHIFFIHSSVDGHLGCFHVLALLNSSAVTIGCMYLFQLEFRSLLDICPGVGLQDQMVESFYFRLFFVCLFVCFVFFRMDWVINEAHI